MKWINKKRNRKGFTLVELVVVIAILGILAVLVVPKFSGQTKKASISAHNATRKNLEAAATLYLADKGVPTEDITWKTGEEEKWEDYLNEWPTKVKGTGEKDIDGEDYIVTITKDGGITVAPKQIGESDGKTETENP